LLKQKTLGVSTIDTFLLSRDPKCPVALVDLWAAVEELFIDGKVNTVGLSDARLSQLAALAEDAQYPPTVLELRRGWGCVPKIGAGGACICFCCCWGFDFARVAAPVWRQ
jgi:hypothetical protein